MNNWVDSLIKESFEINGTQIDIYILNINTLIYRGESDALNLADRSIAWFGDHPTASLYGPVSLYKLKKVGFFFAMDTPRNIRWLKSQLTSDTERKVLEETFEIRTDKRKKYVFRMSEAIEDAMVATALSKISIIDGWIHLTMQSHNSSGFMGPEIMIQNPGSVVEYISKLPYAGEKIRLKRKRPQSTRLGLKDVSTKLFEN